jgi:monooxygenase
MALTAERAAGDETGTAHVDVLVVGAGLSGIGAAHYLQTECPWASYTIFEARDAIGGTWDLFRYPGIRSDSDMHTLGYSFRPWDGEKSIADGHSILEYIKDTAEASGITPRIRFNHRVTAANWSSEDAVWQITAERVDTGERVDLTAGFLFSCSGYYRYDEGYLPEFAGMDDYRGTVVHPQQWPETLDFTGKRLVVIGSGATAVTLVPALARSAAHVTMLQRSPSYVAALPDVDKTADLLRRVLPGRLAHGTIRWKNAVTALAFYQFCRRRPESARRLLQGDVQRKLPVGYPIDPDFTPSYGPWDQRMCVVPNGDLFRAIRGGALDIVTGRIATFTEDGIELESGRTIDADIIITATGLQLLAFGGIRLTVDGEEVTPAETVWYRGMMFSGVPNLALSFGYTNASWTLRADLTWQAVTRLLNHMDRHGFAKAVPVLNDPTVQVGPFWSLTSGYIRRSSEHLPKQGSKAPWRVRQNFVLDFLTTKFGRFNDGIYFSPAPSQTSSGAAAPNEQQAGAVA